MVFKEIYLNYCFVMDYFWFYFAGIWFVCSQNFVVFIAFFEILLSFWKWTTFLQIPAIKIFQSGPLFRLSVVSFNSQLPTSTPDFQISLLILACARKLCFKLLVFCKSLALFLNYRHAIELGNSSFGDPFWASGQFGSEPFRFSPGLRPHYFFDGVSPIRAQDAGASVFGQ